MPGSKRNLLKKSDNASKGPSDKMSGREFNPGVSGVESSYRSIFEYATDAIYIQDRDAVFLDVNPAGIRMYGYKKEEVVGFTPEKLGAPGKNDLKKTLEHVRKAFNGEPQRFEWWGRRKNGEIFPKEIVLNKGTWFGREAVFAMSRDITERLQVLEALRESEDKYRSLTDQIPVGVYRTSPGGQFLYSNPALIKMLNYTSSEELLKLNVKDLYANPADREAQIIKANTNTGLIQSEFQLMRRSGELIWVKDNSRLIFDRNGNPLYFDGILEDITESRNAATALKESEANLKALIENTLENIWSVNRNYEIQYINEVFATAFKYTFGVELRNGVNIVESLPENIRQVWKERYDRTFANEHFVFEDRVDINDASVYIEVSINPIVVDGEVVGASLYGKDITEKKTAQLRLHYLSDMQKLLIDLSIGFINLPLDQIGEAVNRSLIKIGEFVSADRAYVFEYDFDNNTGTNTFEWCSDGIVPQINNLQEVPFGGFSIWIDAHCRGEVVKVNDVNELPHNRLRKFLEDQDIVSSLTIPLIEDGKCTGFVGYDSVKKRHMFTESEEQLLKVYAQSLVNVRERIKKEKNLIIAKEKAEESDRLKSAFLANMSHEIRTPMNGIIGFLELLREPDLSEENKNAYIEIVTQSSHRLLDTINDIIEISKIETGEIQMHFSTVDISELMSYFHGFFKQQALQKGLTYTVMNNLPREISNITTDRNKLESIISNLIKNALKFTHSGSVEFGSYFKEGQLVFFVRDTGIGISAERLDSIFERFVQADTSLTRPQEGSGLGLSIVRAYIENLKGKIWVQSEPGKGSTFTFSIPYLPADEVKDDALSSDEVHGISGRRLSVLIAEDDYASCMYLENILSAPGITFLHTVNGNDTVKAVRENPGLSIVLMDIRMPGMNGLEAAIKIREFNKSIPIIAQTAYALTGDREAALKAGCSDYVSKPVNRNELIRIVSKYLEHRKTD